MAACAVDGSVTTWDLADNKKFRAIFKPSTRPIAVVAFSPDGKSLVVGGDVRLVRLIDAISGEARLTLRGPRKPITGLAFAPDGKTLASAADGEPALFAWDVAGGPPASTPTLAGASPGQGFACLAFSPDGRTLFAGGERGVSTFDMTEGHRPSSLVGPAVAKPGRERATLRGHADAVRSLTFLEGGSRLVTRAEDGVVKVWDLPEGRDRFTLGGGDLKVRAMAIRPDGKTLAVGLRPPKSPPRTAADAVPGEAGPAPEPAGPPPAAEPADQTPRPTAPVPAPAPPDLRPGPPPHPTCDPGRLPRPGASFVRPLDEKLFALLVGSIQEPAPPPVPPGAGAGTRPRAGPEPRSAGTATRAPGRPPPRPRSPRLKSRSNPGLPPPKVTTR